MNRHARHPGFSKRCVTVSATGVRGQRIREETEFKQAQQTPQRIGDCGSRPFQRREEDDQAALSSAMKPKKEAPPDPATEKQIPKTISRRSEATRAS